jgi:iron-sulfur cluster assembly protein
MATQAVVPVQEGLSGMFKVTVAAAEQIARSAQQGGAEGLALRLAAHQAADGAIAYRMGFDEASEDDIRHRCEGVDVVMAPEYVPLLDQATLDFVELEPGQHHFIFANPKDPGYVPPETGADGAA